MERLEERCQIEWDVTDLRKSQRKRYRKTGDLLEDHQSIFIKVGDWSYNDMNTFENKMSISENISLKSFCYF